jgi:hypothetical protein
VGTERLQGLLQPVVGVEVTRGSAVGVEVTRGIAVGIATAYGLDDRGGVGVRVLLRSTFSLLHIVQTDSGAHPASFQMSTRGSYPEG